MLSLGRLAWLPSTLTDLNITSSDAGRQVTGVTAAAPEEVSSATGHRQESRTGRESHRRNRRPSQIHSDCLLLLPAGNAATVRRVSEESLESATASNEQRSSRSSRSRIRIRNKQEHQLRFRFARWFCFRLCVCRFSALKVWRLSLLVSGSERIIFHSKPYEISLSHSFAYYCLCCKFIIFKYMESSYTFHVFLYTKSLLL